MVFLDKYILAHKLSCAKRRGGISVCNCGRDKAEKELKDLRVAAKKMADAIREWNKAKQERESWKPIVGQMPPVGILGDAKLANALLDDALKIYDLVVSSI